LCPFAPICMSKSNPFKWRHYEPEIILLCVRWYLTYPLSYRQVAEMVNERGLDIHHSTIYRWVQQYAPELDKRCRSYLRPTNDSWRVDETYIKIRGKDRYLYRAVDSQGKTIDFLLTAHRDAEAAKRFLRKALKAVHNQEPRVINVDKNAAYPKAIDELKEKEELSQGVKLRQNKYLRKRNIFVVHLSTYAATASADRTADCHRLPHSLLAIIPLICRTLCAPSLVHCIFPLFLYRALMIASI